MEYECAPTGRLNSQNSLFTVHGGEIWRDLKQTYGQLFSVKFQLDRCNFVANVEQKTSQKGHLPALPAVCRAGNPAGNKFFTFIYQ